MIQRVVFRGPIPTHLRAQGPQQREFATRYRWPCWYFDRALSESARESMHQSVTNTIASMSRAKVAPTPIPLRWDSALLAAAESS